MKLYLNSSSDSSEFYTLAGLINSGKSSVQVYKAKNPEDGKTYAVKLFSKTKGESSHHFLQERDVTGNLNHPHIIKHYGFYEKVQYRPPRGYTKECSAIIMEYVPHGDLFNLVAKEPLSEKLARTLFRQMVSALEYLHNEGIAHLDLKPENFLMSTSGIKLIDFDFSHKIAYRAPDGVKGTPGYRSPELAQGNLINSIASDIYSLGVVLFTMVAGCPPYEEIEVAPDIWEFDKFYQAFKKNKHLFWESHNNFKRQAGQEVFTEEFKQIVDALMHPDPEQRPSVEEIKSMAWYNGETYTDSELEIELKNRLE